MVSVIASSVRKGNVIEKEGKLYLVITAENIHPGKGTSRHPVWRCAASATGWKTVERLRTTDSIEKAFVEHQNFNYLYQDGDHYIFMQPETFDQLHVSGDVVGDAALSDRKYGGAVATVPKATPSPSKSPARHLRDHGDRASDEGPDGVRLLQARAAVQRRAHPWCPPTSPSVPASW